MQVILDALDDCSLLYYSLTKHLYWHFVIVIVYAPLGSLTDTMRLSKTL